VTLYLVCRANSQQTRMFDPSTVLSLHLALGCMHNTMTTWYDNICIGKKTTKVTNHMITDDELKHNNNDHTDSSIWLGKRFKHDKCFYSFSDLQKTTLIASVILPTNATEEWITYIYYCGFFPPQISRNFHWDKQTELAFWAAYF